MVVPSKLRPAGLSKPMAPAPATQVPVPVNVPLLLLPETSLSVVPVPSSSFQSPTKLLSMPSSKRRP